MPSAAPYLNREAGHPAYVPTVDDRNFFRQSGKPGRSRPPMNLSSWLASGRYPPGHLSVQAAVASAARADTGGYPFTNAVCQSATDTVAGVQYCQGSDWALNGKIFDPSYGILCKARRSSQRHACRRQYRLGCYRRPRRLRGSGGRKPSHNLGVQRTGRSGQEIRPRAWHILDQWRL